MSLDNKNKGVLDKLADLVPFLRNWAGISGQDEKLEETPLPHTQASRLYSPVHGSNGMLAVHQRVQLDEASYKGEAASNDVQKILQLAQEYKLKHGEYKAVQQAQMQDGEIQGASVPHRGGGFSRA
jgi:hypothetical protein